MRAQRTWAWPLTVPYWAGLRVKDGMRAAGLLPVRQLSWPVVSVGSLSAGGAGKTPAVIALADLLGQAGHPVDVLSRGFGRRGSEPGRVRPEEPSAAATFGDEPVLIANRTGVPVWVANDRFEAGALAEKASGQARKIHLLDDGFQHRELARELDVVLVTAADLEDAILPAGNRREPLSALKRANVIVVRDDEAEGVSARLGPFLKPGTPIWRIRRTLKVPAAVQATGGPVVAFCGIARPLGFFDMLKAGGLRLHGEMAFPDHHTYTLGDVSRIARSCHLEDCGFITTEKDAVKLGPELRSKLESAGGLHVAGLTAVFLEPAAVVRMLEARLG